MKKIILILSLCCNSYVFSDEHCGVDIVTQASSASTASTLNHAGAHNNKCKNCPSSLYESEGEKLTSSATSDTHSDNAVSER